MLQASELRCRSLPIFVPSTSIGSDRLGVPLIEERMIGRVRAYKVRDNAHKSVGFY